MAAHQTQELSPSLCLPPTPSHFYFGSKYGYVLFLLLSAFSPFSPVLSLVFRSSSSSLLLPSPLTSLSRIFPYSLPFACSPLLFFSSLLLFVLPSGSGRVGRREGDRGRERGRAYSNYIIDVLEPNMEKLLPYIPVLAPHMDKLLPKTRQLATRILPTTFILPPLLSRPFYYHTSTPFSLSFSSSFSSLSPLFFDLIYISTLSCPTSTRFFHTSTNYYPT